MAEVYAKITYRPYQRWYSWPYSVFIYSGWGGRYDSIVCNGLFYTRHGANRWATKMLRRINKVGLERVIR